MSADSLHDVNHCEIIESQFYNNILPIGHLFSDCNHLIRLTDIRKNVSNIYLIMTTWRLGCHAMFWF